jgi:hypothetical protein
MKTSKPRRSSSQRQGRAATIVHVGVALLFGLMVVVRRRHRVSVLPSVLQVREVSNAQATERRVHFGDAPGF